MVRWFRDLWIGSESVEFASSYGLADSVARLKAATRAWSLFNVSEQLAVGRVSESRVSLQRVIPMVGNSFKPIFVGRFEQRQDKVVLAGRFTLNTFVKIFMAFWFGFCALFVLLALLAGIRHPAAALAALPGLGMFALGMGMTRLAAWFSRNDPAWLSGVIRAALNAPASDGSPVLQSPVQHGDALPRFIAVVTGVFCLFGVMCFAGALQHALAHGIPSGSSLMARYPDAMQYGAILNGVLLLACAYGIYRRFLFAWWAGFVVLLLGQTFSAINLLSRDDLGTARTPAIFFCLASVVIVIIWARWWYAQRIYFHR